MYNTTTIPTIIVNNGPTIFHALLSGFIIVMPFFAGIFHLVQRYDEEHRRDGDEDSDEEEKKSDEEEEQYIEEFKALSDRELTDKDFKELETKMVKETIDTNDDTKKVDIIMSYDKNSETFWYYTNDLKEIAYKTLESVARKFVIEHNCKRLYLFPRNRVDQLPDILPFWIPINLFRIPQGLCFALIHDQQAVAHLLDDTQIMRDKQIGQAKFLL
jgi:hypothetical protein